MEPFRIPATDGYALGADFFPPQGRPKALILINSAMGVRMRYYAAFAHYLAKAGYLVFTYDYRGIGSSRPLNMKGFEASVSLWANRDFAGVTRWLEHTYPGLDRYLITHSVGGQILALTDAARAWSRILLVASQHGYYKNWRGSGRMRIMLLVYGLIPLITQFNGYFPARRMGLFEDLPAGVAQEWARWIRAEDYLFSCVPEAAARAASIKVPMLSLAFSDDTYAPSVAVDRLLDKFSAANPARRLITPQAVNRRRIDHFGFFREGSREELWPEALSFLSGNGQA